MVEADSHLKLLPTFILDTYKVFEHIDMLPMGMQLKIPRYRQWTDPHYLAPRLRQHHLNVVREQPCSHK